MTINNLLYTSTSLLKYLDIDPNKFDINSNLVLLFWQKKHGKQYAFLTDQYCETCIDFCNKFGSITNDENISFHINKFTYHVLSNSSHSF